MPKSTEKEFYHPLKSDSKKEWLLCHTSLGAVSFLELGKPERFSETIAPEWLKSLAEEDLEVVWDSQDLYLEKLLEWITKLGVVDAFISGAEEHRERVVLEKFHVPDEGHFTWQPKLARVIPSLNFHNLYLRAQDGSELIVYESDSGTVFVKDKQGTLPDHLKIRQFTPHFRV